MNVIHSPKSFSWMTGDFIGWGLIGGFIIRLGMIIYSVYHDRGSSMKYTDIDYQVFTDAAKAILSANQTEKNSWIGSPYDRSTYRYTPLLALILTPNHFIHPCWGKALFSLADLIIGFLLYLLCPDETDKIYHARAVSFIWLLNPFVINISTRGSSEAILGVVIIGFLYSVKRSKWNLAAVSLGLAVHLKIYPFIYGFAVLAHLRSENNSNNFIKRLIFSINYQQIKFTLISFLTFSTLNLIMFSIWGYPFIESSYLYHLNRLDHRHNFSPYFYPFYLRFTQSTNYYQIKILDQILKFIQNPLISFIPQISLSLILSFYYAKRDIIFSCFIGTYSFVIFNKVSTSQYFIWYLWFIPLLIHKFKFNFYLFSFIFFLWFFTQVIWLLHAFKLEFLGHSIFFSLWLSSLFFFVGHSFIIGTLIIAYSSSSINNHFNYKLKQT